MTLTCVTNSTMELLIAFRVGPATLLRHMHTAVRCRVMMMMMTKTCRAWIYPCCNSMFTEQKSHIASPQYRHQNASFLQPDSKSAPRMDWSQSHVPHQQLSVRSGDELSAVKSEAGQRDRIIVRGKVLEAAFVVIRQLQEALCKHSNHSLDGSFNGAWFPKIWSSSNAALCPQRPQALLGMGSPGRPPPLWHSSWAVWKSDDAATLFMEAAAAAQAWQWKAQGDNRTRPAHGSTERKQQLLAQTARTFFPPPPPEWCTAPGERHHSSSI